MERVEKGGSERGFRAGLRELARHRPDLALGFLRAAVDSCPASDSAALSARLYWLSVALLRLDRPAIALKSLASAQKLRPRGLARRAYGHLANDYGMPRRASSDLDDFHAFYAIHVCRYLGTRQGRRFGSQAESEAITRLIALAWKELRAGGRLTALGAGGKLSLFRSWPLEFPSIVLSGTQGRAKAPAGSCPDPIRVDFRRGKSLGAEDRCTCGSGLPWRLCCGRTASPCELH